MIDKALLDLVSEVKDIMISNHLTIAVAESCTGGLLASCLTSLEGSSNYFSCGFVTYSNQTKISLLNIPSQTIKQFGAVSKEVAEAMALGAIHKAESSMAISITGIAGPAGGTLEKPVGTVWIAITYLANIDPFTPTCSQPIFALPARDEIHEELTAIKHRFVTKSYLSIFDPMNYDIASCSKRQMIRYLSCQKALKLILQNIN